MELAWIDPGMAKHFWSQTGFYYSFFSFLLSLLVHNVYPGINWEVHVETHPFPLFSCPKNGAFSPASNCWFNPKAPVIERGQCVRWLVMGESLGHAGRCFRRGQSSQKNGQLEDVDELQQKWRHEPAMSGSWLMVENRYNRRGPKGNEIQSIPFGWEVACWSPAMSLLDSSSEPTTNVRRGASPCVSTNKLVVEDDLIWGVS